MDVGDVCIGLALLPWLFVQSGGHALASVLWQFGRLGVWQCALQFLRNILLACRVLAFALHKHGSGIFLELR